MSRFLISLLFVVFLPLIGFTQKPKDEKSKAQPTKLDSLLGKWIFHEFVYPDESVEAKKQNEDANKTNKGLILTFSPGNKFKSEQKVGIKVNNVQGNFKLLGNDRLVIMRDTLKIIVLDGTYLKLYRDYDYPIAVFKRL